MPATGRQKMSGLVKDLLGWFTLCLLLQGVDVFIIKNVNDQCLEASLGSSRVLTKKCNPGSQLQEWKCKQNWLYNQGAKRCLSANEPFIVQTAVCENRINLRWNCQNHLLIHMNTTQFLTSDGIVVSISKEKSKKSKWILTNNTNICEEQLQDNPQITSATLNKTRDRIGVENQNKTQKEKTTLAQQSHAIEDPTNWNYSILALAFVTLFLAFLILALSSRANKQRKIKALNEAKEKNETETDLTQKAMLQYVVEVDNITETDLMLQSKQDYNSLYPVPQTSSPKVSPKPGQILVEWKDGNISSLFTDGKEDDV